MAKKRESAAKTIPASQSKPRPTVTSVEIIQETVSDPDYINRFNRFVAALERLVTIADLYVLRDDGYNLDVLGIAYKHLQHVARQAFTEAEYAYVKIEHIKYEERQGDTDHFLRRLQKIEFEMIEGDIDFLVQKTAAEAKEDQLSGAAFYGLVISGACARWAFKRDWLTDDDGNTWPSWNYPQDFPSASRYPILPAEIEILKKALALTRLKTQDSPTRHTSSLGEPYAKGSKADLLRSLGYDSLSYSNGLKTWEESGAIKIQEVRKTDDKDKPIGRPTYIMWILDESKLPKPLPITPRPKHARRQK